MWKYRLLLPSEGHPDIDPGTQTWISGWIWSWFDKAVVTEGLSYVTEEVNKQLHVWQQLAHVRLNTYEWMKTGKANRGNDVFFHHEEETWKNLAFPHYDGE